MFAPLCLSKQIGIQRKIAVAFVAIDEETGDVGFVASNATLKHIFSEQGHCIAKTTGSIFQHITIRKMLQNEAHHKGVKKQRAKTKSKGRLRWCTYLKYHRILHGEGNKNRGQFMQVTANNWKNLNESQKECWFKLSQAFGKEHPSWKNNFAEITQLVENNV